jgi:hypothetical protein
VAEIKLKDFLLDIAKVGGIKDTDFDAALSASALSEISINDSIKEKFNQAFLTRERALNDPEVVTKIQKQTRAEVFDKVDERLKSLYGFVDDETKTELDKTFETYKRLDMLKDGLEKGIKTKQSKASSEDVRKIEDEWVNKLKNATAAHEKAMKEKDEYYSNEKLNFALRQKIGDFKISDSFASIKEQISESIINKVRNYTHSGNKTTLELGADGILHIRQNVDGSLRDIFTDGNNKLSVDSLLQKELEPFVVKSNGAGANGANGSGSNGAGGAQQRIELPVSPTLHQLIAATQPRV